MGTSSPMVPKLSTEILLIPAILEVFDKESLKKVASLEALEIDELHI